MFQKFLFLLFITIGLKAVNIVEGLDQSIKKEQEKLTYLEDNLLFELNNFDQKELDTLKALIKDTKDFNDKTKIMVLRRLSKINNHIEECKKKNGTEPDCMLPLYTEGTYYEYYRDKNPCNDKEEITAATWLNKEAEKLSKTYDKSFKKCQKCEFFIGTINRKLIPKKTKQSSMKLLKKYVIEQGSQPDKGIRFTEKNLYEANQENLAYFDSFLKTIIDTIQKKQTEG